MTDEEVEARFDIPDENVFFTVNGKEHCIQELALAILLVNEVCFLNQRPYSHDNAMKKKDDNSRKGVGDMMKIDGNTTIVFVNCNDLFYWATGDAEDLPREEIGRLYKMWKANKKWGDRKWCCLQRKLRPQVPIVEDMKKEGFWDAELEALPAPEPS